MNKALVHYITSTGQPNTIDQAPIPDPARGIVYLITDYAGPTGNRIDVCDLMTRLNITSKLMADILVVSNNLTVIDYDQYPGMGHALSSDGAYLYLMTALAESAVDGLQLSKIDTSTLTEVAAASLSNPPAEFTGGRNYVLSPAFFTLGGVNYIAVTYNTASGITPPFLTYRTEVFDVDAMVSVASVVTLNTNYTNIVNFFPGEQPTATTQNLYYSTDDSSGVIPPTTNIASIRAATFNKTGNVMGVSASVGDYQLTDFDAGWTYQDTLSLGNFMFDATDNNIICTASTEISPPGQNGTSPGKLVKLSSTSKSIIWSIDVPKAYGTNFTTCTVSPLSSLQSGSLLYLPGTVNPSEWGVLPPWNTDTTTGALLTVNTADGSYVYDQYTGLKQTPADQTDQQYWDSATGVLISFGSVSSINPDVPGWGILANLYEESITESATAESAETSNGSSFLASITESTEAVDTVTTDSPPRPRPIWMTIDATSGDSIFPN